MKTLLLILLTIPIYCQTYVGINGGYTEGTVGISANIRYDMTYNVGTKLNWFYSDNRNKDIFSLQTTYIFNKQSLYTPMISFGAELNDNINPLLSIDNLFKIQDYFHIKLGMNTNFKEEYYNIGLVIRFKLIKDKNIKHRFF